MTDKGNERTVRRWLSDREGEMYVATDAPWDKSQEQYVLASDYDALAEELAAVRKAADAMATACKNANVWLESALECRGFVWDVDQWTAAQNEFNAAEQAVTAYRAATASGDSSAKRGAEGETT